MKNWLGKGLRWGAWITVVTTIVQLVWMGIVYVHPAWAAWRTPKFWTACYVSLAYSVGKVSACYYSHRLVMKNRAEYAS